LSSCSSAKGSSKAILGTLSITSKRDFPATLASTIALKLLAALPIDRRPKIHPKKQAKTSPNV